MSRLALAASALFVGVAMTGCAPAGLPADRTVDVHGSLTRTAASSGPEGWILATDSGTLLAVTLPEGAGPRPTAACASIRVDGDFPVDGDEDETVAALEQVMNDTGEALEIVAFCDE